MNFRVAMKEDAYILKNPNFYNCVLTRLHNVTDVIDGELVVGMGHFLPGGGSEMAPAELEVIFYVQKGEMTITMDDEKEYTLSLGDSIHLGVGTGYSLKNKSSAPAELVVMEIKPLP